MVRCEFVQAGDCLWECVRCGAAVRSCTGTIWATCGRPLQSVSFCGPGCQLRRSLEWWGIRDDGSCGCDSYAAQMDAWGDDCWAHLEEIVEHLRGAAAAKGLPFLATAARIMVARAIDAAKQEQAHGQKAEAEAGASNMGRAQ